MRGGYRVKTRFRKSQNLLLDALWEKFGGVSEIAKMLKVSAAAPTNWRRDGHVSNKYLRILANKLEIPIWALSYEFLVSLDLGPNPPKWEAIVKSCGLAKWAEEKVLKGVPPCGK